MNTMRAAVATGLRRVRCEDVPAPNAGPGELVVRTELASICGSDLHLVYTRFGDGGFPMPPGAPGHESVGVVTDPNRSAFGEGDRVLVVPRVPVARAFAEYQVVGSDQVLELPPALEASHLLMAQQLGTVIFACRRLPLLVGKTVVVIGQGTAGLFHDFWLSRLDAGRIIAVEPMRARRALAAGMGADETVDVTDGAATEAVLDLTDGEGADIVIDAVGTVETLNQTLDLAKPSGRIAAFGLPTTRKSVRFQWAKLFDKSLTMYAVHGSQNEPGLPDFRQALDLIAGGAIDVGPLITHELPLARIQDAFDLADSREDGAVKVVVRVTE